MKRRHFTATALAATSLTTAAPVDEKPALLGGPPVRKGALGPSWPVFDQPEEKAVTAVLRSGKWWRGGGDQVARFEAEYAKLTGATYCQAVANGTSALICALGALGVTAGDEVIVPPYTFVATVNAVLMHGALPVFVDSHPDSFQMDHRKVEAAITDRTVAILPVHVGGGVGDLDAFLATGRKRNLPVIEDAAQAHLAQWRGKHVGSYGVMGCFSFQASKNLNSGEGGAVVTSDEKLMDRLYAFQNNGRSRRNTGTADFTYGQPGGNFRLTEFQGALLLAQMHRIEAWAQRRESNAAYLTELLKEVPGIVPARMPEGCTRNAYHLYMFRYQAEQFAGLPREKFLKALRAEGVSCSGGYEPLNKDPLMRNVLQTRGSERLYGKGAFAKWQKRNECPENDRICREAVWFTQTMLLAERPVMEQIATAIRKIHKNARTLSV
jgi:perosamine synthetase